MVKKKNSIEHFSRRFPRKQGNSRTKIKKKLITKYPKEFYRALDNCVKLHDAFNLAVNIGMKYEPDLHLLASDIRDYLRDRVPRQTIDDWVYPLNEKWRMMKKKDKRRAMIDESEKLKSSENCQLYNADFRDVKIDDNSIDLIFTDPPYDEESLPLYYDLAEYAGRVLKPGGSIVTYFGQYMLIEFAKQLEDSGLKYWWMFCVKHTGAKASFFSRKIFVGWKPLLWFVKGDQAKLIDFVDDFIESEPPDKIEHDWEQSVIEAEHVIKSLTVPGMKVLDPFMGSGTTAIACDRLDLQFIGAEIDEDIFKIGQSNIARSRKQQ